MKFYNALPNELANSFKRSQPQPSIELIIWLHQMRDSIANRCMQRFVLLFITLLLLSLIQFDLIEVKSLFGIELVNGDVSDQHAQQKVGAFNITYKQWIVFIMLVVGNLVYVVSIGAFIKGITLEYVLHSLALDDHFKLGKESGIFISSHPLNILSIVGQHPSLRGSRLSKGTLFFTNTYSKYGMMMLYGSFFYINLLYFLVRLWDSSSWEIFSILVFLNVLTTLMSMAIVAIYHRSASAVAD